VEASLQRALEGLIAAGPVAVVLGTVCYFMYQQNKELMQELRSDKTRMLLIAMRVTKAVEVLAGIDPPDESEFDEIKPER